MKVVTFKVQEDLLLQLDFFAINKKVSRSEVIREAIKEFLKNHKSLS